jgi:glycerol-3-phosphate acyltransferase PlsY
MNPSLALLCIGAYLLGAVPFGYLYAKAHGVDIFKFGSGNPGATNVGRALGKKGFAVVFAFDVVKGALPAGLASAIVTNPVNGMHPQLWWFIVGVFAILGHCYSPFLKFKGGKGIATSLGAGVGAAPAVALPAFAIFLVLFAISRIVSLSSIVAVLSTVVFAVAMPGQAREVIPIFALLAIFIVYRHCGNIKRLMAGTEPKYEFGRRSKPEGKDNDGSQS